MNPLDICRLCLEKLSSRGSIVTMRSNSFQTALTRVFPFELILERVLPDNVCKRCSKWVWEFSSYSEFVENNQRKLHQDHLLAVCGENVQRNVINQQQNLRSTFKDSRSARYEDSIDNSGGPPTEEDAASPVEPFSCELGLNDSIEVGKYELQEVENEESSCFRDGIHPSQDDDDYKPAFSIENIDQPHEGSKKDDQEKPKISYSACESPSTMCSEASAGSAKDSCISGATADIRKHTSREPAFIDGIDIDDNELLALEREEMESANNVLGSNPITPMITEPEEALQNPPKTIETKVQTTFSCGCCKEIFTERRVLEKHLCRKAFIDNTNTQKSLFKQSFNRGTCPICTKQIQFKNLQRHINAHEGAYRCDVCGRNLSSSNNLKDHQNRFHADQIQRKPPVMAMKAPEVAYRNEICGRHLSSSYTLKDHQNRIQTGEIHQKPSQMTHCPICAIKIQFEYLMLHMKAHSKQHA